MKLRDKDRSSGNEKSGHNMFGQMSANSDKYYAGTHEEKDDEKGEVIKDAAEESEEPGKSSEVMAVSTKKKWWKPGNPLKSLSNPFWKGSRVRSVPGKNGEAGKNEVGDFANGFTNLVTKKEGYKGKSRAADEETTPSKGGLPPLTKPGGRKPLVPLHANAGEPNLTQRNKKRFKTSALLNSQPPQAPGRSSLLRCLGGLKKGAYPLRYLGGLKKGGGRTLWPHFSEPLEH
eukprot:CAMPEP_0198202238 /NCGR_PEP_ID=MMETSP1445-20131203/5355_1 /TAXON_ID=36898 /ORGANISM="Pyramimonas sp., Strain CCMP2087" /LENGTH=230 /DNA_ID=CAMNT_0043873045 /DNA_START=1189 /DNA_END=1881 /DNA_ORIENTATION=-